MINIILGIILGIVIVIFVIFMFLKEPIPVLIGPEVTKENLPLKTYTLINELGEKEYIITSKSIPELLSELGYLADKKENSN